MVHGTTHFPSVIVENLEEEPKADRKDLFCCTIIS